MGWDASRPVPWPRLAKEWLVYAAIMAVIFAVFFRSDGNVLAIIGGLLVSAPLYLLLGYVLAKFGYTRKTLGQLSTPRSGSSGGTKDAGTEAAATARARPAPTRRTSSGSNRPSKGRRR